MVPTFELRVRPSKPGMLRPGGMSPCISQDLTALGAPVIAKTKVKLSPVFVAAGEVGFEVNAVAPASACGELVAAIAIPAN